MTTFRGVAPLDPADPQYALGYRYMVATASVTIGAGVITDLNAQVGGGLEDEDVTLDSVVFTAARSTADGEAESDVLDTQTPGSTEQADFEAVIVGETEGRRLVHFDKDLTPAGSPGALPFHFVHYGVVGDVFTTGGPVEQDDGPLTGPGGLQAKYYSNTSHTGLPAFEAVENVEIERGEQVSTLNMEKYSARWVGYVRPALSGNYRFRLVSDGRGRVTLGDNVYIDDWGSNKKRSSTGPVKALVAGEDTFLKVETANPTLGWECTLYWETPDAPGIFTIVPVSVLYYGANVSITSPRQQGARHYVASVNRYLEA
jgi:hypothetical protein